MDAYTFYSSIIGSLAWPLTTLIVLTFLLLNLKYIAEIVESVSYGDGGIKFRKELDKVDAGIEVLQQETPGSSRQVPMNPDLIEIAEKLDPKFAIIEGWKHLEEVITDLYKSRIGDAKSKSIQHKARELLQMEVVNNDEYEIIKQLRELRNIAVHSREDISLGQAYQFLQSLAYLIKFLSQKVKTVK